jgi:hypothetical protein
MYSQLGVEDAADHAGAGGVVVGAGLPEEMEKVTQMIAEY